MLQEAFAFLSHLCLEVSSCSYRGGSRLFSSLLFLFPELPFLPYVSLPLLVYRSSSVASPFVFHFSRISTFFLRQPIFCPIRLSR